MPQLQVCTEPYSPCHICESRLVYQRCPDPGQLTLPLFREPAEKNITDGKIKHRKAWHGHNRYKKSATRWRRADGTGLLSGGDAKRVDRMLGK